MEMWTIFLKKIFILGSQLQRTHISCQGPRDSGRGGKKQAGVKPSLDSGREDV